MSKDWTGNKKTTFVTLGASSHCDHKREQHDYYATDPTVIDDLFAVEEFSKYIWECACGELHLSNKMKEHGKIVINSDIVDRVGDGSIEILDFLKRNDQIHETVDIITNPPYSLASEFVSKAIELLSEGRKCAMFLKLTFCESEKRKKLFETYPPKTIYVFSKRKKCALNGDFENTGSSAVCYAWFVWVKGYKGETTLKWI